MEGKEKQCRGVLAVQAAGTESNLHGLCRRLSAQVSLGNAVLIQRVQVGHVTFLNLFFAIRPLQPSGLPIV
jgi:hypothetical protein